MPSILERLFPQEKIPIMIDKLYNFIRNLDSIRKNLEEIIIDFEKEVHIDFNFELWNEFKYAYKQWFLSLKFVFQSNKDWDEPKSKIFSEKELVNEK